MGRAKQVRRGQTGVVWVVGVFVLLLVGSGSMIARGVPDSQPTAVSVATLHPGWTNVTTPPTPPTLAGAMMAYSSAAHRFVLFGGWNGDGVNQTWVYDPANQTWSQIVTAVAPATRGDAQFAYDSHDDLFVLFGGWHEEADGAYVRVADTWTFSLENRSWREQNPAVSPPARSDAATAYDPVHDRILVFGGFNGTVYLGDAWSYSYENDTWSPRTSPLLPSPRADGRMVYDAADALFFLYGGNDYSDPSLNFHHLADTWTYSWDSNLWTEVATTGSPGPRDYAVLAYDSRANALLLFGGYGNRTILGDTWSYTIANHTWTQLTYGVAPPGRFAGVGGYDPVDSLLVIFGGLGNAGLLADTWFYSYGPSSIAPVSGSPLVFVPLGAAVCLGLGAALVLRGRRKRRDSPPPEPSTREPGSGGAT